uniref:Uncharacterized protein n=1 Tax=Lobelia spicata TaxID=1441989 RepID=A0A291F0C6_9ASTR|nr:hypothetical protein Lo_spi1Pt0218 [Lobelia spicata]ATG25569.1 hypothetical protein Lo_spi1Pt0218 [Lobelia spicata]
MDRPLFRDIMQLKLHFLMAILLLKYLETWGLERTSVRHKLAFAYLLNRELETSNWLDRLALTYIYVFNKGLEPRSLVARIIHFYVVKRGLQTQSLFGLISRSFRHLLKRGFQSKSVFDKMALIYLLKRCDEAVHKGLSVSGLGDVFDLAKEEGIHLINLNLERISQTPTAFETTKIALAYRSVEAFENETPDAFRYNAELGYWTGALERLCELEKEEN